MDCSKTEVFLLEWERMCELCDMHYESCAECILYNAKTINNDINLAIKTVQEWSDERPRKTRQSEFLKLFPNVELDDGVIFISPCGINTSFVGSTFCAGAKNCFECRKAYWLTEVE